MSKWNGYALIEEFSQLCGDQSTNGKIRVAGWINEIMIDIASRYAWPFTRFKGKKVLEAENEEQSLSLAQPSAPSLAAASGGSLLVDTYYVKVAFGESISKIEGLASVASSSVTTDAVNKTLSLTAIPVSDDPLVNRRFIYLKKGSDGDYLYHGQIEDNTTTTYSITTNVTDNGILNREPIEYDYISGIDGNPFLESSSQLVYKPIDQLRLLLSGEWGTGTPTYWSPLARNRCLLYNAPSSAVTLSFYYFKIPNKIYYDSDSIPELPIFLKPVLEVGVEYKSYFYRDRNGKQGMKGLYESELFDIISRKGRVTNASKRVRDVTGGSGGYEL